MVINWKFWKREPKHKHTWGKWGTVKVSMVNIETGKVLCYVTKQQRECKTCGYKEIESYE